MSGKKVSFVKPSTMPKGDPDAWVKTREVDKEAVKRLSFDVSEGLHRRLKSQCASRGRKMRDVIIELIEEALERDQATK
jgi:hypothetical protein